MTKTDWNKLIKKDAEFYTYANNAVDYWLSGEEHYNQFIKNDDVIKQLGSFSDKTCLDYGCGIGRITKYIANDFKKVYGLDISEEALKLAKQNVTNQNVKFIKADLRKKLDIKADLIFSSMVLQHLTKDEQKKILGGLKNLLNNGGIVKIQVRGREIDQGQWYSGDVISVDEVVEVTGLKLIKSDYTSPKELWIWLKK